MGAGAGHCRREEGEVDSCHRRHNHHCQAVAADSCATRLSVCRLPEEAGSNAT